MATLPQQIAEKFLAKLSESADIEAEMIEKLRSLLAAKGKLKADDLVKVFSPHPEEPLISVADDLMRHRKSNVLWRYSLTPASRHGDNAGRTLQWQ